MEPVLFGGNRLLHGLYLLRFPVFNSVSFAFQIQINHYEMLKQNLADASFEMKSFNLFDIINVVVITDYLLSEAE